MHYTKGGMTRKELLEMPFDDMDMYIKEALRIQEESNSEE